MERMALPDPFIKRKTKILQQLAVPDVEYDDLSPKGSVDEGIRELIAEINKVEGAVTTSSCAGRVAVFLEGRKTLKTAKGGETQNTEIVDGGERGEEERDEEGGEEGGDDRDGEDEARKTIAKAGGKGGGGRWLFVSHDPIPALQPASSWAEKFGMIRDENEDNLLANTSIEEVRWVHFKFEPMVSHSFLPHSRILIGKR
jgi:tRNA wybutosine-synthesizing protein 3